jgi:hypothetical protein
MLQCQGGQVRVGRQVASSPERFQKLPNNCAMPGTGVDDAARSLLQPKIDQIECRADAKRVAEKPGPRGKTQECKQNGPGDTNWLRSGDCLLQPRLRASVLRRVLVDGINEDVGSIRITY